MEYAPAYHLYFDGAMILQLTTIADTRTHLGELHGLSQQTEVNERMILQRAENRLDEVNRMIERQRPGIEGAPDHAQDRYLSLVTERGQLHTVIAKSRQALES